jgi:DNA recombination protein RmuC
MVAAVLGIAVGVLVAVLLARVLAPPARPGGGGAVAEQVRNLQAGLGEVTTLVRDLERERARGFGVLEEQLQRAGEVTRELSTATRTLNQTLSNPTTRGSWGERLASDVLRAAGFVEGLHYHRQRSVSGGRVIPDFTFTLPDERRLHLDVKFPLDNFQRALDCDDEVTRQRHLDAFVRDVRDRVREVGARGYVDPSNGTAAFALLFVPNEAVYAAIHEHDPALIDEAMARRVVLCSPLTLFAVLGVVRQTVEAFAVRQRSDEILDVLGRFEDQWERFVVQLQTLGSRLDSAKRAFDDLDGVRRRQLERPLGRLADLRRGGPETPVVDDVAS